MGWHYVAVKTVDEDGNTEYSLHEEFTEMLGGPDRSWTASPVTMHGESVQGLATMLRCAADDVLRYAPIEDAPPPPTGTVNTGE
jgi:hypothetical protein